MLTAGAQAAGPESSALPFGLAAAPGATTRTAETAFDDTGESAAAVLRSDGLNRSLGVEVVQHAHIQNRFCGGTTYCPAAAAIDLALWLQQGAPAPALTGAALWAALPLSALDIPTAEDMDSPTAPVKAAPVVSAPRGETPAADRVTARDPAPQPAASVQTPPPAASTTAATPAPAVWDAWWVQRLTGVALILGLALVPLFVFRRRLRAQTVHDLIHEFYRRVDLAKQHHAKDQQTADALVCKAFDQLHEQARKLLDARKIRLADLKRAVLLFHSPDQTESSRWSPPTLSQLGYMLATAEKLTDKTPVLALYKYSGEEPSRDGQVFDTYTILKEGIAGEFSEAFAAKVQSPFAIKFAAPGEDTPVTAPDHNPGKSAAVHQSGGDAQVPPDAPDAPDAPEGAAQSDYQAAYVLSLMEQDDATRIARLQQNLDALATASVVPGGGGDVPALAIRSNLLSLINEDLRGRPAELAESKTALREAPQLLLAALADFRRREALPDEVLMPIVEKIRLALAGSAALAASEHRQQMFGLVLRMQALAALETQPALPVGGITYVDARGAEADAPFLRHLAQLAAAAVAARATLLLVSELTRNALRAQLAGYMELQPGRVHETALDALIAAIDARRLTLHTVSGSLPLRVAQMLGTVNSEPLVVCVDPALTVLEGMPPSWQYVLWTPAGQACVMERAAGIALADAAQRVRNGAAGTLTAAA